MQTQRDEESLSSVLLVHHHTHWDEYDLSHQESRLAHLTCKANASAVGRDVTGKNRSIAGRNAMTDGRTEGRKERRHTGSYRCCSWYQSDDVKSTPRVDDGSSSTAPPRRGALTGTALRGGGGGGGGREWSDAESRAVPESRGRGQGPAHCGAALLCCTPHSRAHAHTRQVGCGRTAPSKVK